MPLPPPQVDVVAIHGSLLRLGWSKLEAGDHESARIAFMEVARDVADDEMRIVALHGLGRSFREAGEGVKAIATYEHLLAQYPGHVITPTVLLDLGRALRDMGSHNLALNRFYSVLHTTLRLSDPNGLAYRRVVRTAQFEIAETQVAMGHYDAAARLYERLELLDLSPKDRARMRFKAAEAWYKSGQLPPALHSLQQFVRHEANSPLLPEAKFLLASLLARNNRHEESLQVTLALLRQAHTEAADETSWQHWQRRTGNQLANQFYERGEFIQALTIYRALADLDPSPGWRLPILYQIGLCLERLHQPGEAVATYRAILDHVGNDQGLMMDLARWRMEQLEWWNATQARLIDLPPATT
jgi:tetratricopeptide (TPR) repeat protein